MPSRDCRDDGFSFVEVLIALAILLAATAPLLHVAASGQRLARSQGEATDQHQRLRVAAERLRSDLTLAGAGVVRGELAGGLTRYMAPLVPARIGARSPDAPLSAFTDRLTIVYAAEDAWPATLTVDMSAASDAVPVNAATPGCPAAGLCGFADGSRALIVDTQGVGAGHELFTVTGLAGDLAHGSPNPPFTRPYQSASAIVMPVVQRVYHFDRTGRRLMVYDGYQSDLPLIDNVVDVRFAYFADAVPSSVPRPPDGTGSCVYNPGSPAVPLLDNAGSEGLHELTLAEMTDGPRCGTGANAFDGDLLRIRLVRVTLRLEAAADDVRGIGEMFTRPGRSSSAYSFVPDYEVTFDVAPRNMTPASFLR